MNTYHCNLKNNILTKPCMYVLRMVKWLYPVAESSSEGTCVPAAWSVLASEIQHETTALNSLQFS